MANRGRPTQIKRQRERARQERAKIKGARRAEAKTRRELTPSRPTDHDVDIVNMVPGPQEPPDWQREFLKEEEEQKEKEKELSESKDSN